MAQSGINIAAEIIADGRIHRYYVEGDRKGTKNAWAILHIDDKPAGQFGCNKRLGNETRVSWKADCMQPMTPEEKKALVVKMRSQRAQRAAEDKARHEAAAIRANEIWEAAKPATRHPYTDRKGVQMHGLRVGAWPYGYQGDHIPGTLIVPLRVKGQIRSLQAIFPSADNPLGRDKTYLSGGLKEGLSYTIGALGKDTAVVMVGEGFATCASAHEATGYTAVVAFDAGNLASVSKRLREALPKANIVLLADNDQWTDCNPGLTKATEAALSVGGLVALPPFTADEPGRLTDFNDLHQLRGPDDVRSAVKAAIRQGLSQTKLDEHPKNQGELLAKISVVKPKQTNAPVNSEDDIAMRFVEYAGSFRWSPGLGWMVDDGISWHRDDKKGRFDLARRVCREVASACDAKAESEAKRIASAKTVSAIVTLAQSDPRMIVPNTAWDADPLLLNTPDGIVDLRTGVLRARDVEFVTQTTVVAPDFTSECPTWLRFLHEVFCGDASMIEFMQRSMGYWLSGSIREQVVHFFYGQGSNGKSVLSDFLKWIVGSYGLKLVATALMQSKGDRHPTEQAQLRGKRLALSSELGEHDYFNEALLKELTGDTTLSARFMRGDFFEFVMTQKHLIVGNFKPRLRGGDPAIGRRMLLVSFNATFKGKAKDMHLLEKLKAEAPAILAWMIEGAVKWHKDGLAVPTSVLNASADYMADNDDMAQWITERCELTGEAKAGMLYANFFHWKMDRGENPPSQTVWGSRLSAMPGITKRRSGGILYSGIKLAISQY